MVPTTKSPSVKAAFAMLEYFAQNEKNYEKFSEQLCERWKSDVKKNWRLEAVQIKYSPYKRLPYKRASQLEITWRRKNRVMVETITLYPYLHYGGAWSGQRS